LRVGEEFRRCLAEFAAVESEGSRDLVGIVGLLSGPLEEFTYWSEPLGRLSMIQCSWMDSLRATGTVTAAC
jgi:hypothetical protein